MPAPDLSWFCCVVCGRRPMPQASFSLLLTTCSHIVCSSCWDATPRPPADPAGRCCPSCGAQANTLNLSAARSSWPKQLVPYFKSPVELLSELLSVARFQEHQKKQSLSRRKVGWVLINHGRAKEDYDKEYAECKALQARLQAQRRSLKEFVERVRARGVDPLPDLCAKFGEGAIRALLGSSGSSSNSGPPATPFFTTPQVGLPLTASTPATNHPTSSQEVEFTKPKKLPHTMRGCVTSLTVRRSPSNPPTPTSQLLPSSASFPPSFPAKRQRVVSSSSSTPALGPEPVQLRQRQLSGQPAQPMEVDTQQMCSKMARPVQRSGHAAGHSAAGVQPGVRAIGPAVISTHQPQAVYFPQQPPSATVRQFGHTQVQHGRPTPQTRHHPTPQSIHQPSIPRYSHTAVPHSSRPPGQFTPLPGQPATVAWPASSQPGPPHSVTPQQSSHPGQPPSGGSSVRIRAVPQSSIPRRPIFPTPSHGSRNSHPSSASSTHSHPPPSHSFVGVPSASPSNTTRITIGPPPSLRPVSQAMAAHSLSQISPLASRAKTPTNPSPLLTSYTTPRSSSPWQRGQRSRGSSPWQQGHTSHPGTRGSGSSRGPRLTPMRS